MAQDAPVLQKVCEKNGLTLAELAEDGLTPEHRLDLEDTMPNITPDGHGGFDLQTTALQWDANFR